MHRNTLNDTSIVYKDVYLPNLCVNLLNKSLYAFLVSYIAYITLDILYASSLVVVKTALECSLVDVVENNHVCTCFNKCLSNIETDTVRSTSDPSVLTFKRKWICHSV